ncbi:acetolactate synthase small subunit [bacterium]|nr:acetolactate synthase small subunit [bacterium]MCK4325219.1 acetolactate synthase small subunit [bacterium]MCK4436404.1 acetolactate synthase small subunit [bacterium]
MKHTISALVENRSGVLAHISTLFSARGFNIDSLAVGETDDPAVSKMTIVLDADERILEQVVKQLRKLIDVIKVQDLTGQNFIDRELVLVKINATPATRSEIMQTVDIFRAKIVDAKPRSLTVELTGDADKINGFLELVGEFGIKDIVRTGKIAMARGNK